MYFHLEKKENTYYNFLFSVTLLVSACSKIIGYSYHSVFSDRVETLLPSSGENHEERNRSCTAFRLDPWPPSPIHCCRVASIPLPGYDFPPVSTTPIHAGVVPSSAVGKARPLTAASNHASPHPPRRAPGTAAGWRQGNCTTGAEGWRRQGGGLSQQQRMKEGPLHFCEL